MDVVRVHVLPVYESLPNNEKELSAEQLLRRYLQPYFLGRFQLVSKNDQLDIDGVTFRVQACEPDKGIVTSATEIYAEGEPLRAEDIRRQQEIEDEQLARRLQQQEDGTPLPSMGGVPRPMFLPGGLGMSGLGLGGPGSLFVGPGGSMQQLGGRRAAAAQSYSSADELRARMQQLYSQLPPEHHGRMFIASLIQTLGESQGANRRDIEALPTRVFHNRPATLPSSAAEEKDAGGATEAKQQKEEENREAVQCMVCNTLSLSYTHTHAWSAFAFQLLAALTRIRNLFVCGSRRFVSQNMRKATSSAPFLASTHTTQLASTSGSTAASCARCASIPSADVCPPRPAWL